MKSIQELVRRQEADYIDSSTTISEHVEYNQYENIQQIEAYLNSRHTSGRTDSMDREKPFFNIVTAAVNIWYRATDIDRRNIRIKATRKKDYVSAFLATIHLHEWMKKSKFGIFLNEWGRTLARYGSAVTKFVEKEGELHAEVIPWNRLICDPVDFDANPKIEKLYFTPAQLRKHPLYDQDVVEALIDSKVSRKTLNKQNKDNKADFIEVYEVHGDLPLSLLTDNEDDEKIYRQQMHIVSFVGGKKKGTFDDFTLYKGKESKDPYSIAHLIKEDGRTMGIGAVEHLFEAQWMMNHTVLSIKNQLDLASKLIFQTSDSSYVGRNALNSIESGDILVHEANQPLTQINNNSHDITSLQSFGNQWKALSQEIVSTPDVLQGKTLPSGTAFRQAAIIQQESHSLFEIMTENKGLSLEEMFVKYIIPHLKKKMDTSEEISATLSAEQVMQIDSMFVPNEVNRRINEQILQSALAGRIDPNVNPEEERLEIQQNLAGLGNQRFVKPSEIDSVTWKEVLKDLEWDIDVEVTNENSEKEAILTTMTSVFQTLASNPGVLQDPNLRILFSKIIETAGGMSPLEISQASAPQLGASPQGGQEVGGALSELATTRQQ